MLLAIETSWQVKYANPQVQPSCLFLWIIVIIHQLQLGKVVRFQPGNLKLVDWGRRFESCYGTFLSSELLTDATLSENCLFLGTDNVRGQISAQISRQMEDIVYLWSAYSYFFFNAFHNQQKKLFNNYSPNWRWIVMDINHRHWGE